MSDHDTRNEKGSMAHTTYIDAVKAVIDHLQTIRDTAIDEAADRIVRSVLHGGAIFCSGIGHGIDHDFTHRAGGLALIRSLSFEFTLNDGVADCLKDRPRDVPFDRLAQTVRLALRGGALRSGDVVLIGSVSGRNPRPVEIALGCRELGIQTIGLTSLKYTQRVKSAHPSGKRLFEVVDVVIDNGAPYGDASVAIPGLDVESALPVSGVGALIAGWMLFEQVARKMVAAGSPPTVFKSVNREGGREFYEACLKRFHERGY